MTQQQYESVLQKLAQMMSSAGSSQSPGQLLASVLKSRPEVPKAAITPEEMAENIERAKNLYESTQKRKGKKAPFIPDHNLILSHRMQKEEILSNVDGMKMINSNIFDVYHSKVTELDKLKPILINDLLMETWHEGRFLLCRTIEEPYRINAVMSIVEDETGRISFMGLYNYTKHLTDKPDPYLPVNTILAIKEPYFKATTNGAAMIRCDSPSDVVIINYLDDNYKKLKVSSIRNWESFCSSADRVHAAPVPNSPKEWKTRGNDLYKRGLLKDAVRAYSLGLSLCQEKSGASQGDKDLLTLNRSAAYLTWGRFDDAANDAIAVLESMPSNVKALSRAARSYYQLRSFELSFNYFKRCFELDPSCEKDLIMCRQRLKEQYEGNYDWSMIHNIAQSNKAVRLDIADYMNRDAIEITFVSKQKGRGVIAKRDILPGTLLLVCKAFAISFADEVKSLFMITTCLKRKVCLSSPQVQLINSIIYKLLECPSTGESLYQLWSGKGERGQATRNIKENGVIDYDEISSICHYNSFCRGEKVHEENIKMKPLGSPDAEKKFYGWNNGTGLWITSSFFNHSCLPNTHPWYAGDVMVRVSSRFIRKGEELTVAYTRPLDDLSARREHLSKYGILCDCTLCIHQSGLNYQELSALKKRFETEIAPRIRNNDTGAIPKLERLIKDLKKVYEKAGQSRFQFALTEPLSGLALLYQMKGRIHKSVQIYEQVFRILSNIKDIDSYMMSSEKMQRKAPKDDQTGDDDPVYFSYLLFAVVHLVKGYRQLGNLKSASKWESLLIMFEGFEGLDEDAARKKHNEIIAGIC